MGIKIQAEKEREEREREDAKSKREEEKRKEEEERKEKFDEIELKVAEHMQNNEYETAMMIIGKASALGFNIDIQKAAIETAKEKYEQNIMKEKNDKLKRDAENIYEEGKVLENQLKFDDAIKNYYRANEINKTELYTTSVKEAEKKKEDYQESQILLKDAENLYCVNLVLKGHLVLKINL